jgi:hypothetical protein
VTLPFDSQIHRALLALGFTITGDVAELVSGGIAVEVIEFADGKFRLTITLPSRDCGALTFRLRRDKLLAAAGRYAEPQRRRA